LNGAVHSKTSGSRIRWHTLESDSRGAFLVGVLVMRTRCPALNSDVQPRPVVVASGRSSATETLARCRRSLRVVAAHTVLPLRVPCPAAPSRCGRRSGRCAAPAQPVAVTQPLLRRATPPAPRLPRTQAQPTQPVWRRSTERALRAITRADTPRRIRIEKNADWLTPSRSSRMNRSKP